MAAGSTATPVVHTATAAAAQPAAHATAKVAIKNFTFTPATLRVAKATRVTWTNRDDTNHTVTFKHGPGNLGNLNKGKTRSTTFTTAGTYTYICQYHPGMHGKVIVR